MKLTTAFKSLTALGMAILVVAAAGCTKYSKTPQAGSATNGITKLACDVTFENIMQQEIEVFEYIYPHADVLPYYLDEKSCIDSLLEQKVNAAVTTRPLNEAEKKYLKSKKKTVYERIIAIDAIALVVNNDNPIDRIDLKDLNDILTGKLQTWNQMGPGMKDLGSIDVVFDDESSSTVSFMRDSLMNGEPFGSNVYAQGSNESVYEAVVFAVFCGGFCYLENIFKDPPSLCGFTLFYFGPDSIFLFPFPFSFASFLPSVCLSFCLTFCLNHLFVCLFVCLFVVWRACTHVP